MLTTELKPISQLEYLRAEFEYLLRRIGEGDREKAAESAATIRQELWMLGLDKNVCGRITTTNGRYYRWPFLDE